MQVNMLSALIWNISTRIETESIMEKQHSISRARKAVEEGKVNYIHFYRDGSGFEIELADPTGDQGMPCLINLSFSMDDAPAILAGGRFDQNRWNN